MIKRRTKKYSSRWNMAMAALAMTALPMSFVSCIDEDLSRCGVNYAVDYRLELSASMRLTLDEQLTTPAEQQLAAVLKTDLAYVMTNRAAVMDLSFFTSADGNLTYHQSVEPDASSLSMTIYMNRGSYHNIALATTRANPAVGIYGQQKYWEMELAQADADTVDSHRAAIYRGQSDISVDSESDHFYVPLYMLNSVPVLVVNPATSPATTVAAYVHRTASGVNCADSTFIFRRRSVVRTSRTDGGGLISYHAVCFPSENAPETKVGDITAAEGSIWEMDLYTRMPDGKYVKNTLYVKDALKAGEMQVVKVQLDDDGRAVTDNPEVGVSVELDWKPGGDFDIEI